MTQIQTGIIDGPLSQDYTSAGSLHVPEHGCVVSFVGVVRSDHNGKAVSHLIYDCYKEMAAGMLQQLAQETLQQVGDDCAVAAWHGTGLMQIGEASVALHVAAGHRPAGFDGCRFLIERLKEDLPVWKQEFYSDGSYEWLKGS